MNKDELHKHLLAIMQRRSEDYVPYGSKERGEDSWLDCSCGCMWFIPLLFLSDDWGTCTNEQSHRCGLLTFEHQGCGKFEGTNEETIKA